MLKKLLLLGLVVMLSVITSGCKSIEKAEQEESNVNQAEIDRKHDSWTGYSIIKPYDQPAEGSDELLYQSGWDYIRQNEYPQAIGVFSDLGDYKDSKDLVTRLRYIVDGDYIGAGSFLIAAIKSDGTVVHRGGYERSKSTESWEKIKTISVRGEYIEGLDSNGNILTTCPYTVEELRESTLNSSWAASKVVEEMPTLGRVAYLKSNYPSSVFAILDDGTLQILGSFLDEEELETVHNWRDIVSISGNDSVVVGLRADGSVVAAGEYSEQDGINQWKDIVAISTYFDTFGLKRDGTVVAAGQCKYDRCGVKGWADIIAIAAGANFTVGLKKDGTVVSTGDNSYGQRNLEDWTDIVAIDASWYYTLGLKRDGTLLLAGDSSIGGVPALDVFDFSGLFVPAMIIPSIISLK